jgi:hypothetical protein
MDESADENAMNIDNPNNTSSAGPSEENTTSIEKNFRTNSLLFASFPWFTSLPMVDNKISELLHGEVEYGYVRQLSNL